MPLPWRRKNKVKRISQIVADLQSPKRGSPLVVETGFPTSLIDLFMKNKDWLKNFRAKKRVRSLDISDPVPLNSPSPLPPPTLLDPHNLNKVVFVEPGYTEVQSLGGKDGKEGCGDHGFLDLGKGWNRDRECGNGLNSSSIFVSILKIFGVVTFSLSTKSLYIGITMSIFTLLLLECFEKLLFQFWLKKMVAYVGSKSGIVNGEIGISGFNGRGKFRSSSSPIDEIEIVEPKTLRSQVDIPNREEGFGRFEMENSKTNVLEEVDFIGRGSGKKKTRFLKKIVPKKLRNAKKGRKKKGSEADPSSSEVSSIAEEDDHSIMSEKVKEFEQQDSGNQKQDFLVNKRPSVLIMLWKQICEEDETDDGNSNGSYESGLETLVNHEKGKNDRDGKLGYLILCLFVLAGLLGGRFVALLITVTGCLISKMVKARWTSVNVPWIRYPIPISG